MLKALSIFTKGFKMRATVWNMLLTSLFFSVLLMIPVYIFGVIFCEIVRLVFS